MTAKPEPIDISPIAAAQVLDFDTEISEDTFTVVSEEVDETPADAAKRQKLEKEYSNRELDLTEEQEEFIATKLSSKLWRMDNLYTIRDKNSIKQIMRLNASQRRVLTRFKHNRKIILKSRQQGISTLFLAYYLDSCLFHPGFQAGIQSYGQDEADKLAKRAQLMWDEFDPEIKELLELRLVSNNAKGMTFSNGSILKIGNFRGDTLQGLHVSELGKIAKKYPDKAKELKTGAFQAVSVENKITIESTAEGRTGLFYEMWAKAETRAGSTQPLTPLDFQPIFLSWVEDPDCQLFHEYPISHEAEKYITELHEELGIELTLPQKYWLSAKMEELGEDFDQEYPATPERAFAAQVEGMYFKRQYQRLRSSGRIKKVQYDPRFPVDVGFDIGWNDEFVMIFAQVIDGVPRVINEYHNSEENIEFYCNILKSLPYNGNYGTFIMPHDANTNDVSTGRTRLETFRRNGIKRIKLLNKLSFQDSIEAARQYIDIAEFSDTCENTLLCLQNYRKKYDKTLGVFLDKDVHDIHSNYAAALRYLAQGTTYHKVKKSRTDNVVVVTGKKKRRRISGFAV